MFLAANADLAGEDPRAIGGLGLVVVDQLEMLGIIDAVGALEDVPDIARLQFAARAIGQFLHMLAEMRLHPLGQLQPLVLFQHPCKTALAALRIDADHRLIAAPEIGRIDRQIGHRPERIVAGGLGGKALLDRVLVAAGKGREHQFAAIGVARVDGQLVAIFNRLDDFIDVREIERGVNALGVEVHRHGHQAAIAGALAIAKQASFDAVGARHQPEFGGRNARAPVVMGVERDDRAVAVWQVAAEIFDLVSIDVGRCRLNRSWQIEDDRVIGGGGEDIHHRLAAFDGEVDLGGAERLWRIFEMPFGLRETRGLIAQQLGAVLGDLANLGLFHAEHHLTPQRRYGVIDMDDGRMDASQALKRSLDQILAALRQDLDQHVLRHAALIDQPTDEIIFGGASRRKANLDLFETDFQQQVEKPALLLGAHRVDERLVAIAQVRRQPARRLGDGLGWPRAVGDVDLGEGSVFDRGIFQHGHG